MAHIIHNLYDLCLLFGADCDRPLVSLNRRLRKDTACGASISLKLADGSWRHNGDKELTAADLPVAGFTIQTIVEGSEATVDSDTFTFPVRAQKVRQWITYMEQAADELWHEVNDSDADDEDLDV